MSSYADLKHIEDCDPDGGDVEPTEAAYVAHREWAIRTYGRETWNIYRRAGWEDINYF